MCNYEKLLGGQTNKGRKREVRGGKGTEGRRAEGDSQTPSLALGVCSLPSQGAKDFWMTPGGGPQPVGINPVVSTEISQAGGSDDGRAVDFVTHPFIGWAINWPSMGVVRRLTSEHEWGVWGGERWALVCWVIPSFDGCHAIIHQSHDLEPTGSTHSGPPQKAAHLVPGKIAWRWRARTGKATWELTKS